MVEIIQGEAKTLKFTITDSSGSAVDCSSAQFTFGAKYRKEDETMLFVHSHDDFDVTDASSGIVTVGITTSDTSFDEGEYAAQLRTKFSATNVDVSNIDYEIVKGVL